MTIAEAFVEEGLQKGLYKGRQEGRQESLKNILDRQIRRRFPHDVTSQHLHLINEADSETLSDWAENLVVANSIDEVFQNENA